MKQFFSLLAALFISSIAISQVKNPVNWTFSAKKIDATTYELHLTASINPGWHIYTIDHSADIGVATNIVLKSNPLATPQGKVKVVGKAVTLRDPSTAEMVKFYERTVDFVQVVKLIKPLKTSFSGTVEYMACDDKQCLPPTEKPFTIALQ